MSENPKDREDRPSRSVERNRYFELYGIPVRTEVAGPGRRDVIVEQTGTCVATLVRSKHRRWWWQSTSYPDKAFPSLEKAALYHATEWRRGR